MSVAMMPRPALATDPQLRPIISFHGVGKTYPNGTVALRDVNLAIHHWEPSFVPMVETMRQQSANMPLTTGSDVGYKYATVTPTCWALASPCAMRAFVPTEAVEPSGPGTA